MLIFSKIILSKFFVDHVSSCDFFPFLLLPWQYGVLMLNCVLCRGIAWVNLAGIIRRSRPRHAIFCDMQFFVRPMVYSENKKSHFNGNNCLRKANGNQSFFLLLPMKGKTFFENFVKRETIMLCSCFFLNSLSTSFCFFSFIISCLNSYSKSLGSFQWAHMAAYAFSVLGVMLARARDPNQQKLTCTVGAYPCEYMLSMFISLNYFHFSEIICITRRDIASRSW